MKKIYHSIIAASSIALVLAVVMWQPVRAAFLPLSVPAGGTGWGNFLPNTLLIGNGTGSIATTSQGTNGFTLALVNGVPTWVATSTLSTISGTLAISRGGTGTTTAPSGQLIYGGGAGVYQSVATTSVTCSGNTTCTTFNVLGSSPITISSTGGGTGLSTSSPTANDQVLVYNSTGAGSAYTIATTSLSVSGPFVIVNPIGVLKNGTITYTGLATTSQPSSSNLLVSNGAAGVYGVATSSETCSGVVNCAAHTVLSGGGAITITGGTNGQVLGWLSGVPTWTASSSVAAGTGISIATAGAVTTVTNSSPLSGLSAGYPFSFSNPTLTWLGLGTTTNSGMSAGNLYVGTGGIFQTAASSSIFGYTPLNPTRQLTISSANGQLVLSAGAQDLSADRTWTVTYTGLATTTQPSSSNLLVSNGGAGVYGVATTTLSGGTTGLSFSNNPVVIGASASSLSGTLAIANGGTGTTTAPSGQLIYGGGNGVYQSVATTSVTCSGSTSCTGFTVIGTSPITISSTGGSTGLSTSSPTANDQVLIYNSAGAGSAYTIATTSLAISGPFVIPNPIGVLKNGTVTYTGLATTSQPSSSNLLVSNGGSGVYGVATSSFTTSGFPANISGAFGAFVGGTNSTWTYWGLATTSNLTQGQLLYNTTNGNGVASVATGTISSGVGISLDNSTRSVIGGSLQITNSSPLSGLTTSFPFSFSNPTLSWTGLATSSGITAGQALYATGVNTFAGTATTTLSGGTTGLSFSNNPAVFGGTPSALSGTLAIVNGGTGTTTAPSGQLLYGGGAGSYQSVATTSVTCSGNTTCTGFTVIGTSPITISSTGGGTGLSTSSPTANSEVLVYNSAGAGSAYSIATTSLSISGPFAIANPIGVLKNGTVNYWGLATTTQPSSSNLLVSNGAAGVYGVATSSETCTSPLSCAAHTVLSGGGAISLGTVGYANGGTGSTTAPQGQLLYGGATAYQSVATSTFTPSAEFTIGGTIGALVGGANSTLTLATGGVALTKLATQAANTVLVNQTSGAASPTALATTTFGTGLYGTGTPGQVLMWSGSAPVWAATSTSAGTSAFEIATTSGIAVSGLSYFTKTSGRTTLGSVATSSLSISGPFVVPTSAIIGPSGAIVYTGLATTSQPSSSNLLVSNGGAGVYGVATTSVTCSGNTTCTSFDVLGPSPITISSTGGGTGLSTTSPTANNQVLVYNSAGAGAAYGVSTTTFTPSAEFTVGGTIGGFVGGANSTLTLATAGVALTKIATQAANTVLVNQTSGAASPTALATSTFGTGLYGAGTGGQVLMWSNVTSAPVWAATSSAAGGVSGGTAGMLTSWVNSTTLTATGTPTATAYYATSSAATSTFLGQLRLGTTTDPTSGQAMLSISNALTSLGGLLITTWTNVVNAFTIKNSAGTTVLNVDTTNTGNAMLGVNTSSPTDTLTVNGTFNMADWVILRCQTEGAKKTAQNTGDLTGSVISTSLGYPCGDFSYIEDGNGVFDFVTTSGSAYIRMRPGAAGSTVAAGDGLGLSLTTSFITTATNTPIMETEVRIGAMANASTSLFMVGFGSMTGVSADYAVLPTDGCFWVASSTQANWQAVCKVGTSITQQDTGLATSTRVTGDSLHEQELRIEMNSTSQVVFKRRAYGATTQTITNTISTNIPTSVLNPVVSVGKVSAGLAPEFHVSNLKVWYKGGLY